MSMLSESTYATTVRDSKRCRERDFLKKVHDCIDKGGKVLIPVFALGRAQELCILLGRPRGCLFVAYFFICEIDRLRQHKL
jgi:Cft2 family RNA processing exonuclease